MLNLKRFLGRVWIKKWTRIYLVHYFNEKKGMLDLKRFLGRVWIKKCSSFHADIKSKEFSGEYLIIK